MRELTHDIAKILVNGMSIMINYIILMTNKYIIDIPIPKWMTATTTNPSHENIENKMNIENDDIEDSIEGEFRGTDFTPIEYGEQHGEQLGYMGKYSETP